MAPVAVRGRSFLLLNVITRVLVAIKRFIKSSLSAGANTVYIPVSIPIRGGTEGRRRRGRDGEKEGRDNAI